MRIFLNINVETQGHLLHIFVCELINSICICDWFKSLLPPKGLMCTEVLPFQEDCASNLNLLIINHLYIPP